MIDLNGDYKVSNFGVIESLDLNLSHGIKVFVGDNASGKTSIAQTVEFLLTGTARGHASQSAMSVMGDARVELEDAEGLKIVRTSKRSNNTPKLSAIDKKRIKAALTPGGLIECGPAGRAQLMRDISGGDVESLLSTSLASHGVSESDVDRLQLGSVKAAHESAVQRRREFKRQWADIDLEPVDPMVETAAGPRNAEGIDIDAVENQLETLSASLLDKQNTKTQIERDIEHAKKVTERISELESKGVDLPDMPDPVETAKVNSEFLDVHERLESVREKVAELQGDIDAFNRILDVAGSRDWPESIVEQIADLQKTSVASHATAQKDCESLTEVYVAAKRAKESIGKKIDAHSKAVKERDSRVEELKKLKAESMPKHDTDLATLSDDIDTLSERISRGRETVSAVRQVKSDIAALAQRREDYERLSASINKWDTIVKLLADGGAVAVSVDVHLQELLPFDRMASLAEQLETSIRIDPDWSIQVDGVPVEMANRGHQMMVQVLLQDLACQAVGLPILVIDEFEHLDQENMSRMFDVVSELSGDYSQIWVMAVHESILPRRDDVLYYRVDRGAVMQINEFSTVEENAEALV